MRRSSIAKLVTVIIVCFVVSPFLAFAYFAVYFDSFSGAWWEDIPYLVLMIAAPIFGIGYISKTLIQYFRSKNKSAEELK